MRTENPGQRKRVVILGATGSIGESALKVARDIPERMEIVGIAANSNAEKLAAAANETRAQSVCLVDETKIDILQRALQYEPQIFVGETGLRQIACLTDAEMVLVAIVGTGGLRPALAAVEAGKDLAVASKEILVMAGEIVMRKARGNGVHVLPVDSEHNAIFQCIVAQASSLATVPGSASGTLTLPSRDIRRIILTASGGPFREDTLGVGNLCPGQGGLTSRCLDHYAPEHVWLPWGSSWPAAGATRARHSPVRGSTRKGIRSHRTSSRWI